MRRSPGTVDARHFWVLPEHEFERAVVLLCDGSNRITSFGGRYSQLLASYLDLMRPHTAVRAPHVNDDPAFLADVGRRSVCVVFDFRRYQRDTMELARAASNKGAKITLITDPWLSPAAGFADVVLPAHVEAAASSRPPHW